MRLATQVYGGTSLPGLFSLARLLRCIVIRERITLVHGHAAFRRARCAFRAARAPFGCGRTRTCPVRCAVLTRASTLRCVQRAGE